MQEEVGALGRSDTDGLDIESSTEIAHVAPIIARAGKMQGARGHLLRRGSSGLSDRRGQKPARIEPAEKNSHTAGLADCPGHARLEELQKVSRRFGRVELGHGRSKAG